MMMKIYTEQKDGCLEIYGLIIPPTTANRDYANALLEVSEGLAEIIPYEGSILQQSDIEVETDAQARAELQRIDMVSIRALREGDSQRLAELNTLADTQRQKLKGAAFRGEAPAKKTRKRKVE